MFVFNKNIDMNEKDQRNALVVKLVDTKDLKSMHSSNYHNNTNTLSLKSYSCSSRVVGRTTKFLTTRLVER